MPELPEVETIRRQMEERVVSSLISGVTLFRESMVRETIDAIAGKHILAVHRFGKLLVITLSDNLSVCIHLKMTGRLTLLAVGESFPVHTHVVFHLQSKHGDQLLVFSDSRRFGFIHVLPSTEVSKLPFLVKLGKEPLKDLTIKDFIAICHKTKRPIKTLLLDQQRISGIGNIYACESLWIAKIHPTIPANALTTNQCGALFSAIEAVLTEGISRGGASDNTYRNLMGGKGKYQNFFKVYMRKGKPCPRCTTPIAFTRLAGRGTFYCPHCQER